MPPARVNEPEASHQEELSPNARSEVYASLSAVASSSRRARGRRLRHQHAGALRQAARRGRHRPAPPLNRRRPCWLGPRTGGAARQDRYAYLREPRVAARDRRRARPPQRGRATPDADRAAWLRGAGPPVAGTRDRQRLGRGPRARSDSPQARRAAGKPRSPPRFRSPRLRRNAPGPGRCGHHRRDTAVRGESGRGLLECVDERGDSSADARPRSRTGEVDEVRIPKVHAHRSAASGDEPRKLPIELRVQSPGMRGASRTFGCRPRPNARRSPRRSAE